MSHFLIVNIQGILRLRNIALIIAER